MIIVVVSFNYAEPNYLQDACREHSKNGYEEADAHALELRDSIAVACEFSGYRDDDSIVNGHPENDTDGVEA